MVVLSLALATPANAAFPGQNGKIAYDDIGNVHSVNPDGTGHAQLTSFPDNHWNPEWSPDGQRILYQSDRDGLGSQVYVMNADGTGQTRLTDPPGQAFGPAWSPDGRRVVFTRNGELWVMDADGTGESLLTSPPTPGAGPDWGPGGRIAFTAPDMGIYTIRPDGTGLMQVTTVPPLPPTSHSAPDWSPDGSRIVYLSEYDADGEGCTEIATIRADGTGGTVVRPATCESGVFGNIFASPAWSPDGGRIASGDSQLFTVRVDGTDLLRLPGDGFTTDWQPLPVNTPSTYPRPKGATPMYLSLVTAFGPCTAPNRTHGPPLAHPSCNPPQPASPNLVVSAGESRLRSIGAVVINVLTGVPGPPDDSDLRLRFSLTNVMRAADLSEYTGELRAQVGMRLTDKAGAASSTTQDFPVSWSVPCAATPDPQVAATCELDTTLDALTPGAAAEGTRAIWALDKLRVYDGGPDGDADTEADNSLFATQGIFVP